MPKVSVIIPTYNREQYILRAIDSVLNQTFNDYEIIVVDDGSTDATKSVLASLNGKIKYIRQVNAGIAGARNRGIKESSGEYIAFLDSDDYWAPEKLTEQVNILDAHSKVGIVFAPMPIINEKGEIIGRKPAGVTGKNLKELLECWGDVPTSTVMTRSECFKKVGVFDPELPPMEDFDMWLRISQYYDLYEIKDKILAYYYRHSEQATSNKISVYEGLIRIYTKALKNFPEAPRKLIVKRITSDQYTLSRIYYKNQQYNKSFRVLCASVFRCSLVGVEFIEKGDPFLLKAVKFIKPYGFFVVCFFQWLINGCFLRAESSREAMKLSPLKVLFIHGNHNNITGQELSLLERMQGLRGLGIESTVLLPDKGLLSDHLRKNEFEVKYCQLNQLSKRNPFKFLKTVFWIRRLIIEGKFSVVHCSGVYPNQYSLPAARLCGRPCFVHINSTIYSKRSLSINFVRYADFVFTVSDAVRKKVMQEIKIPSDKIMTVYDGIENSEARDYSTERALLCKQFNIADGKKVVGQISSIIPLKGLEHFIRMARFVKDEYPDVKFLIVGTNYRDEYQKYLTRLIEELRMKEDIVFTDFQEDIYRFIDLIDISVLASEVEGLSRVIVHAQMFGKPIVATDVGGNSEAIVQGETGLLVPPNDPRSLADEVLGLLKDTHKSKTLGENAKQAALEQFQIERHAKILSNIYQRLLK